MSSNRGNNRDGMPKAPSKEEPQEEVMALENEPVETPKKKESPKPLNVVATRKGFYKQNRKTEGQKFTIEGEHEFSKVWMKKI